MLEEFKPNFSTSLYGVVGNIEKYFGVNARLVDDAVVITGTSAILVEDNGNLEDVIVVIPRTAARLAEPEILFILRACGAIVNEVAVIA